MVKKNPELVYDMDNKKNVNFAPIVSINGALYDVMMEFMTYENFASDLNKSAFLNGKFLIPSSYYDESFVKLFHDCIWCFFLGEKLRIPSFLYEMIQNDTYDGDGQVRMSDYYLIFLDILIQNNLLEIVDYTQVLNKNIKKLIFDSSYAELKSIIHENIKLFFTNKNKNKSSIMDDYIWYGGSTLFDTLLHKYFSFFFKTPVVYIDGIFHSNNFLYNKSPENIIMNHEHIDKIQTLYLPKISFAEKQFDYISDMNEKMKPIIEIIQLLKDSPLKTVIQDNFNFINNNDSNNAYSSENDIFLLKEFLLKQKKINKIKQITFIGDKIMEVPGLFIPFIGALNIITENFLSPIIRKYEKNNIKKIGGKYPSLRHLYFSEKDLLKKDIMKQP